MPQRNPARPGERHDICELLRLDHDGILRRLTEICRTRDAVRARDLCRQLRTELAAHLQAEEAVVLRALRALPLVASACHEDVYLDLDDEVEHDLLHRLLAQLGRGRADSPLWQARARTLRRMIVRHVVQEQQHLLRQLQLHFAPTELTRMARDFADRKALLQRP
ncbi:MAG: hypothetical protein RL654_1339 [Pseudomonadota bacterium]|jgi:hypothetical protein